MLGNIDATIVGRLVGTILGRNDGGFTLGGMESEGREEEANNVEGPELALSEGKSIVVVVEGASDFVGGVDNIPDGAGVTTAVVSPTTPFTMVLPLDICTTASGGFLGKSVPSGPSSGPDACETRTSSLSKKSRRLGPVGCARVGLLFCRFRPSHCKRKNLCEPAPKSGCCEEHPVHRTVASHHVFKTVRPFLDSSGAISWDTTVEFTMNR